MAKNPYDNPGSGSSSSSNPYDNPGAGKATTNPYNNAGTGGSGRAQAVAKAKKKLSSPGILEQISDIGTSVPSGLAHLAIDTVKEFGTQPYRLGKGVIEGNVDEALGGVPVLGAGYGFGKGLIEGKPDPNTPLSSAFGASYRSTVEDVKDPGRFVDAYNQGHIVGKLLEDAGNVAITGGAVAKGLGWASRGATAEAITAREVAAAAEKAAPVAEKVAAGLEDTATAQATELSKLHDIISEAKGSKYRAVLADQYDKAAKQFLDVTDQARAARLSADTAAAKVPETAAQADQAVARAGKLYQPARVAHAVANFGNQGASLPIKPYEAIAKGLSDFTRAFVEKNPALKESLNAFGERTGISQALRSLPGRRELANRHAQSEAEAAGIESKLHGAVKRMDTILGKQDTLWQASELHALGSGEAIAQKIRAGMAAADGQLSPTLRAGVAQRIQEAATAMGFSPEALQIAVDIAMGTADPRIVQRINAANQLWDEQIAPWLEDTYRSGRGEASARMPGEQAMADWNLGGTDLPPNVQARLKRKAEQRAKDLGDTLVNRGKTVTRHAEAMDVPPFTHPAEVARLTAERIGGEATGRGSIARLRAVQTAARLEGVASASERAAARFSALRERLPGAIPDGVVHKLADAVGRWTEARDGLTQAVDDHAAPPEIISRVQEVRKATVEAANRELDGYLDMPKAPFVPSDLSELHAQLHDELGIGERNIEAQMARMRGKISGADRFVKAYQQLWNKLPAMAKNVLEKLDDNEIRRMYERREAGTLTAFEGKLDEKAGEWLDRAGGPGARASDHESVAQYAADYGTQAKLKAFIARTKTNQWGPETYALLQGSAADALGVATDDIARLAIEGVGDSARLPDIAAELARREGERDANAMPNFARVDEVISTIDPHEPITEQVAIDAIREMFGDDASSNAFLDKWVQAGTPPIDEVILDLAEHRTPEFLQGENASGLPILNAQEQARQEISGILGEEGGQALEPGIKREAGMFASRATRAAESAAEKGPPAEKALIGSLTETGAKKGMSEGRRLEKYVTALKKFGVTAAQIEKLPEWMGREADKFYAEIENAPANMRPMLKHSQDFTRSMIEWRDQMLGDEKIPANPADIAALDEMIRQGFKDVRDIFPKIAGQGGELITGPPIVEAKFRPGRQPFPGEKGKRGAGPGRVKGPAAKGPSEKLKLKQRLPASAREMSYALGKHIRSVTRNETERGIAADYGRTATQIIGDTEGMSAKEIAAAMGEEHYVPYHAEKGILNAEDVTSTTMYLPEHIARASVNYWGAVGKWEQRFRKYYDKPLAFWKHAVLALRPAWHVNNIVGNAFMAMVGGGINPVEYAKRMRQANAILKAPEARMDVLYPESVAPRRGLLAGRRTERATSGARLAKLEKRINTIEPGTLSELGATTGLHGPAQSNLENVAAPDRIVQGMGGAALAQADEIPRDPGLLARTIAKSYAMNGAVDDMSRLAVFLKSRAKIGDRDLFNLKRKYPELGNLSDEQLRTEGALRISLKVAGDFGRMTPLERQVFRRIVPFYAWIRHITGLTAHMAITNPVRVIWVMHLADMLGDPSQFGLANTQQIGGGLLQTPTINPFGDVTSLNPTEFGFNLTPAIKVPVGALTGLDVNHWGQFQRPPGQPGGYGGSPAPTSLLGRPGELLNYLGSQFPQTKVVRNVLSEAGLPGGQDAGVMHYPLGQVRKTPITQGHESIASGEPGALGPLARYLGIPYPRQPNRYEKTDLKQRAKARKRKLQGVR